MKPENQSIYRTNLTPIVLAIVLLLSALPKKSSAQQTIRINSNASFAEKIYLQFDGNVYTPGKIIWFKCLVLKAHDHTPSNMSGVLYVELITPAEKIHEKKLIKIENGNGQGFFYLNKNLQEGAYLIRAYTEWNKNFDTNFLFEDYIHIIAPKTKGEKTKPISNVTLTEDATNTYRLEACFNPLVVDSLHKNKLKVFVLIDSKKDSLLLTKGSDDAYQMNYTFENESQFATLQMQTANQKNYSSTIILNKDYIDFQFFPESGELVHGLQSKVGFKVADANGQGKIVQGDIVDEKDSLITSFKSNCLGMGSFILDKVDTTKTYYAQLISQSDENQSVLHPLPDIASTGNVLSVKKQQNNLLLTAASNYLKNDSIYLEISFRGVSVFKKKVSMNEGVLKLLIPINILPEGILSCTMMDDFMRPVAERLYFNARPESRLNITLSTDKPIYAKRELTKLKITCNNSNGLPANANLSLLAINKKQMGKMQSLRQNILSWFLLDSELKGRIENPGFYFSGDTIKQSHLDALMLTQGWRKYNYSEPFASLSFKPELNLTVTGEVSSVLSKRKKKEAELILATFGKNKSFYTQLADSLGKFRFDLKDEFGQNMNILIQSSKKSGEKKNYTLTLDKKESPPVSFNHAQTVQELDSVVEIFVEKNKQRQRIDEAFPLQSGNILIDEVEVTGYNLTPNRKKVMEEYGEPDEVIEGKAIREKEEKWSYGLYSILLFNYPDKIKIEKRGNYLYARLKSNQELTLVVIDGIPVKPHDYELIPNISPSEVSSFEIIEYADNFLKLFCELFPSSCGCPGAPACGNVIAIYTYGQKGIYGTTVPVGLMQTSVPVFSAPREFYAPKYEPLQDSEVDKPDLRALIHWEPILKTDSLGNASTCFYNADNVGKMTVVVEAVSENGEIGYQEIEYEIEGKEQELIIID